MDGQVLVLNQNYEPLNITNARRAITLVYLGKAYMVERDSRVYHSARVTIDLPSVVRLAYYVRRPLPELKLSRRSIFARDSHTCQYCGAQGRPLTVDHVIPRHRGGDTDWKNLVCACTRCNNKKANRTPGEAGMSLIRQPRRPKYTPYISFSKFVAACQNEQWQPYLAPFAPGLSLPERALQTAS
jgi:5-methylcytosine-specific restriction endonuclease McrA